MREGTLSAGLSTWLLPVFLGDGFFFRLQLRVSRRDVGREDGKGVEGSRSNDYSEFAFRCFSSLMIAVSSIWLLIYAMSSIIDSEHVE
jgi:hypothetical protein